MRISLSIYDDNLSDIYNCSHEMAKPKGTSS